MKSIKVKIIDPIGLHARPASILVQTASKFTSDIKLKFDGKIANLKSIMSVMALAIKNGETIEIEANGSDEDSALSVIKEEMTKNNLI